MHHTFFVFIHAGKRYIGLQAAGHCLCGDASYDRYGVGALPCNVACLGEATRMCGNDMTSSVYEISDYGKDNLDFFIDFRETKGAFTYLAAGLFSHFHILAARPFRTY